MIMAIVLCGCQKNETLQHYYVDSQEQPNFLSFDIPIGLLHLDETQLNTEQKEAYNSVQKLNVLTYKAQSDGLLDYETELTKVKTILGQPQYEELMRGGDWENGQFSINMLLGDEDRVKEFVVFGNAVDRGFAIVRILGRDMDPNKIMSLVTSLDKANIDYTQFEKIFSVFE